MVERFLRSLARDLDRAWSTRGWAERELPSLARDVVATSRPCDALDGAALLRFAAAPHPERRGSHPAKGVLPLFTGQRFDLFAHFWVDDFATPHDHGWAGAFHVLEGRSVNGQYRFTPRERSRGLDLGTLRRTSVAVRQPGDTVAVRPSADLIHSVLYIDRPGVAISVRGRRRTRGSVTYFRPGLGLGQGVIDDATTCRLHALEIARALDEALFVDNLRAILASGDRLMAFLALSDAVQAGWAPPPALLAAGEERLGPSFAALIGALDDLSLYQEVAELRGEHSDPKTRALLAALYLSDTPEELREVVGALELDASAEPAESALWSWVGEGLVRLFVDDADDDDGHPSFLAYAAGQLAAGVPVADLIRTLRERAPAEFRDDHPDFLAALRDALLDSPLCRALPLRAAAPSA